MDRSILKEMASRNDASIPLANFEGITTGSKRSATEGSESVIRKKIKLAQGASTDLRPATSNNVPEDGLVTVCKRASLNTIKINLS